MHPKFWGGIGWHGYLQCDVTHSGGVSISDMAMVKSKNAASLAGANFASDVNADGSLNLVDTALIKSKMGNKAP